MGGHTGGRSDAGPNRTTASHVTKGQINQAGNKPSRKDLNKSGGIVDFIAGGGVTGALIRGAAKVFGAVKEDYKTRKTNESLLGTSDYQGGKTFSKSQVDPRTGRDNDGPTQKSVEQPKVKSQMNNSEVKSGLIVADKIAPTKAEMTAEESLVSRKRGKKTKTILTNLTEGSKPTLSKKALLA